uniref:15 kDa selenoprotein n=1 Tax=Zonotrichia albicollis TaxID=44394 RepID=A0A8D2MH00_ZONAL
THTQSKIKSSGEHWPLQHCIDFQVSVYGAQLSSEACRELGFSSNLLCSSCNLLGQFSLNQLDPFCRECCQEEAQLETRKPFLVLKVCCSGCPSQELYHVHSFPSLCT